MHKRFRVHLTLQSYFKSQIQALFHSRNYMKTDTVHFEKALPLTLPRVLHSNGQISQMMKKLSKPIQSMSIISCFFLLHHGDFNAGPPPPPPPHYARNIAFFMDVQTSCRWRNEFNTKLCRPLPGLLFKWYFRKERHKKKAFEYKSEYKS